jgi:ATP-dependent Lon protease
MWKSLKITWILLGGVKEKTIAAKRSGVTELIFPQMNKKDFDELPEYVKRDLTVHFVTDYNDIFKVISSVEEEL